MEHRIHLNEAQRIVIKIGSSSLTHEKTGHINLRRCRTFCSPNLRFKKFGKEIIVVSSGAQAVGISAIHLDKKPNKHYRKSRQLLLLGKLHL